VINTARSFAMSSAVATDAIVRPAFRSPRRVTITLPYATYQDLQARADDEGRSLSNLAAFLLESSLQVKSEPPSVPAGQSELIDIFR
jgi:hypothetical protein